MFGADPRTDAAAASRPSFWPENSLALTTARSGIRLVLESRRLRRIWLPSFLCGAIIDAAAAAKAEPRFYEVNERLSPSAGGWLQRVEPGDMVVFIDYFGFPAPEDLMKRAKDHGAVVLEDACQALFSPCGSVADYVLYSPRKFVGVPDGGILVCRPGDAMGTVRLRAGAEHWIQKSLLAGKQRAEFDRTGKDKGWFKLFQEAETLCPVEPFSMSGFTQQRLCMYNFADIAEKRRTNYLALACDLAELALFPGLPDGVVPLGFPVTVNDRDRVRGILFENRIYPPVHWRIDDIVPPEHRASHRLASEIMTLPCDQRYAREDMRRMSKVLLSA